MILRMRHELIKARRSQQLILMARLLEQIARNYNADWVSQEIDLSGGPIKCFATLRLIPELDDAADSPDAAVISETIARGGCQVGAGFVPSL